ncbi:hypothetical protein E1189_10010 [Sansalvadorimonas verongulae]|nr:hypothetical protein [Sansalvadorimonas verongulae]
MKPVDLQKMVALAQSQNAPAMICQAGYVFVNTKALSRHPELVEQLRNRIEHKVLNKVEPCSDNGVEVYAMIRPPEPPVRNRKRELAEMFQLNN